MSDVYKIRIRFAKTGAMKFIGHLDCMRFFQKVMRLAEIDIRYSSGFSPHQIMSFASPLGVGIESVGEYVDLEVNSTMTSEKAEEKLNQNLPEGLEILSYRLLPDDAKNAMSLITCADYRIEPKSDFDGRKIPELIQTLFSDAEEFLVTKKTKKSEKTLNLKDYVYDFRWDSGGFFLRLSAGSETNIKPELLLSAFFEKAGEAFDPIMWQIIRLDLYTGSVENGLKSLESFGSVLT